MAILKKIFPLSFNRVDTAAKFVIGILIYVAMAISAAIVIGIAGLLAGIPVVGSLISILLCIIGAACDVYILAGIVVQILVFARIIKE